MTPVVPSHPRITTGFKVKGPHWSTGEHSGIDYGSPGINGAEVRAPWSGTITGASWGSAYGNHVVIDFDRLPDGSPGLWGVIAHMSRVVKTRGRVERGELIGYVGATGNVTGPHTHFEIQPQAGWVRGSYRDPMPWHNAGGSGGGGGGDWKYAAGTVIDLRYLTWNGHLLNADKKSTSIGAWKDMMNHHSLVGGTNIPVTEEWGADIADETQKCQAQHLPPADPGRESVFVGPKQFQHVLEVTGAPYVMKDSRPSGPAPQPPVSGVPACPPADQFRVGVSNPAFTWMGQRFLVWLSPQEIAKEGAAYEPGPRFSSYDEENVRKCQAKMGDTPDPPGSAFFGPRQWARLAGNPPGGGGDVGGGGSGGVVDPPPPAVVPWFVPDSLKQLRAEVDARWPDRSTASDGTIGDTAHSTSQSEHNPVGHAYGPQFGTPGAVHAMDITAEGIDVQVLLDATIGDQRVWYVIHDGHIWSKTYDWAKRPYTGSNPHTTHLHVSLAADDQASAVAHEQDESPWIVDLTDPPPDSGGYVTREEYEADMDRIADAFDQAGD